LPDIVSAPSRPAELQLSIHSDSAIQFMTTEVNTKSWVIDILKNGYMPDFESLPTPYIEQNNKSARDNMEIVREKLQEWMKEGFVEQLDEPAYCCNPLSVAAKYDASSDKIKFRPVLDLSRHVNHFIPSRSVQLDDLSHVADLLEQGDYLLAFDLKNQFFHVRLHPEARKFFGFAVPDETGNEKYYQFTVMVYGLKSAVQVVTRLILPLKAYIHKLGIRFSIYVDDGRCVAPTADQVYWQQRTVLHIFQLAGWNVNWEKTVMVPTQTLLYMGFVTDTNVMKYFAPKVKILTLSNLLSSLLELPSHENVDVKFLALVLGKIASMLLSHGSVLRVLSRAAQHDLGYHVNKYGWIGAVKLSEQCRIEFAQLLECLQPFNGQHIYTATYGVTVDLCEILNLKGQYMLSSAQLALALDPEASMAEAYHYNIDGTFSSIQDFVSSGNQQLLGEGVCELMALRRFLQTHEGCFPGYPANIVFWPTSSYTFVGLLSRGSRLPYLQKIVLEIKQFERELSVSVRPLWIPCTQFQLNLESIALQAAVSTDEWSVDRATLRRLFHTVALWPDIDCFSASFNAVCPRFFSRTAHGHSAGVNFFMQVLSSDIVYFCCPPIHLLIPCFRRLLATPDITSYLLFPDWPSASFWPVFFPLPAAAKMVFKFRTPFFYANAGSSKVFSASPNFDMWAVLLRT